MIFYLFLFLLKIFYFFLPAGIANMAPVLFKWIPFLKIPIDFGKTFRGKRILGDNKTFRGFLVGIIASIAVIYIQKHFYKETIFINLIVYEKINPIILGFLMGFGALFGDSVKSFFKRQKAINCGHSWIPFDQIDWILGAIIFSSFYVKISFKEIILSILIFGLLHPLMNIIGYILKIKKTKF